VVESDIERGRLLAPLTTLELGGPAEAFVRVVDDTSVVEALRWARERGAPVTVLGGGSNVVVPDAGVSGLILQMGQRGIALAPEGGQVRLRAAAGEPWEAVVSLAVGSGLAGVECLAGIPGLAGASPIQNVGAYGQEVSDTLDRVRVVDRQTLEILALPADELELAYRDSYMKRNPGRYVILGIELLLTPGPPKPIRYGELASALSPRPGLVEVRDTVLRLRRRKSMVLDPTDPNRRSAGSFFTNPIVPALEAARVAAVATERGLVEGSASVPTYAAGPGRVKLAAGWLIEKAGIEKGLRRGAVGVSTAHALALVHHGGGSTRELLALADEVRARVDEVFGVVLEMEPVVLGRR
jgi:UDP-N-acetylmuramate dehydrogenase